MCSKVFIIIIIIIRPESLCTFYNPDESTNVHLQGGPKKWYLSYIYYIVREVSLFRPTRYFLYAFY